MDLERFSDHFVYLHGQRLGNHQRPYLKKIFAALMFARRTIICSGRQVEKSTLIIKFLAYRAWLHAPSTCLLILPRQQQLYRLIRSRFEPIINDSPLLRKCLVVREPKSMKHITFENGSELVSDSAFHSSDAARGLSTNTLAVDEFQDCAPDALAILEETQSHQRSPRTLLTGTAKLSDNQLEKAYWNATANCWKTSCIRCGFQQQADAEIIADDGYRCRNCKEPIDPRIGDWVPQNPGSTFGESFRLPQIITPWTEFQHVREKKLLYSFPQFRNEVLGESVCQGDLQLSLDDLSGCCTARPLFHAYTELPRELIHQFIIAGIDWGNTAHATTAVTVGVLDANLVFHVLHFSRLQPGKNPDEVLGFVMGIIRNFRVNVVSVDAQGNGSVFKMLLFDKLQTDTISFGVNYTNELGFSIQKETPARYVLNVGKVFAVSNVVYGVKAKRIQFPRRAECASFLVEIASERCVPVEDGRGFRYEKSPGVPDDILHSLVYALSAATHLQQGRPYF